MVDKNLILINQYKQTIAEKSEFIKYLIDEDTPNIWWLLIHNITGNEDEYIEGEYLVCLEAPEDYPYKPPKFKFKTPNGVHKVDEYVCISIGEYHPKDYRAVLGMSGFAIELVNTLINYKDIKGGMNVMSTSADKKKEFAINSKQYNQKHFGKLIKKINENYADYITKWSTPKIVTPVKLKFTFGAKKINNSELDSSKSQLADSIPTKQPISIQDNIIITSDKANDSLTDNK